MSGTSTLGPSATLPSSLSSCTTGLLPAQTGGGDSTCAIGVYSTRHSVEEGISAMRDCCGDATINILDGGCGLSCVASDDTASCLSGKIHGFECSGGSTESSGSGSGESGTTITGGSGTTIISGGSNTVIFSGSGISTGTTMTGSTTSTGSPSGTSATGAAQSTGAAPQLRMDLASKGGVFVAGLLAVGFFTGVMAL